MSLININGNQDDLFYRYKMPPIQSKIEGKGNGIKTVIPNMIEVAKALGRPPMYPCKYFGTELGAQTKHEPKNDRYIVNGAHDAQRLQELLDGFIQKFVLCTHCRNPETSLRITEDGNIFRDCQACGQHSSIDMRHKLVNYILNHPPPGAIAVGSSIKKLSKKKGKGKNKEQLSSSISEEEQPDEAGDAFLAKITEEAKTLAKPSSKEDDWSVDLSKEAQLKRQAELTQGMDQLHLQDSTTPSSSSSSSSGKKKSKKKKPNAEEEDDFGFDDSNEPDPLDLLAQYTQSLEPLSSESLVKEIRRLDIPYHFAIHVITQVVLTPNQLTSDLKKHRSVFQALLQTSSKAPFYFLGGIEVLVAKHDLHKKLPVILKVIYDMDLMDESEILKWGEKPTRKFTGKLRSSTAVHEAAEPFLKWLREAEEEEEDDDDEEEEDENEDDE